MTCWQRDGSTLGPAWCQPLPSPVGAHCHPSPSPPCTASFLKTPSVAAPRAALERKPTRQRDNRASPGPAAVPGHCTLCSGPLAPSQSPPGGGAPSLPSQAGPVAAQTTEAAEDKAPGLSPREAASEGCWAPHVPTRLWPGSCTAGPTRFQCFLG